MIGQQAIHAPQSQQPLHVSTNNDNTNVTNELTTSQTQNGGYPPPINGTQHDGQILDDDWEDDDVNDEYKGLLATHSYTSSSSSSASPPKPHVSPRPTIRDSPIKHSFNNNRNNDASKSNNDWQRPYWLGSGLFLLLFTFWLLDSLKDPMFAMLVNGYLEYHQPPAKFFSVLTTLILVCIVEYKTSTVASSSSSSSSSLKQESEATKRKQRQEKWKKPSTLAEPKRRQDKDVLDAGGTWTRMTIGHDDDDNYATRTQHHDGTSVTMFFWIAGPFILLFAFMATLLHYYNRLQNSSVTSMNDSDSDNNVSTNSVRPKNGIGWYFVGYLLYAMIESFGSLTVANFWSFANSTLSLTDAERYYGPIIAIAQLGAIGGSTMVAANHWTYPSLMLVACLVLVLHILTMQAYHRRFRPTSILSCSDDDDDDEAENYDMERILPSVPTSRINNNKNHDTTRAGILLARLCSGLNLIVRHNYILMILGVSCLYEISLTCLDYQMKLLGLDRFEKQPIFEERRYLAEPFQRMMMSGSSNMSFSQFMGHYGQVVNITSLLLSSILFPKLIRYFGLRVTLRFFPTLLLLVTFLTFGILPGNLWVLFICMSLLKAMTYSIHDPSKELLYLPTSNTIKFQCKFWIDVVGARISKAFGSAMNAYAGSVDRSVRVGTIPSFGTAFLLWMVCYAVGTEFDRLLQTGFIVGLDDEHEQDNPSLSSDSDRKDRNGATDSLDGYADAPIATKSSDETTKTSNAMEMAIIRKL